MNQNLKGLYQFIARTFGVGCSCKGKDISVAKEYYTVEYQDARAGKVALSKWYNGVKERTTSTIWLRLGNVRFSNDIKDNTGLVLTDFECDGLVDKIEDFYGSVSRCEIRDTHNPQKRALLEERFAKADKILASFTSKGELADLIKKAEAERKEKYTPPNDSDVLDRYSN